MSDACPSCGGQILADDGLCPDCGSIRPDAVTTVSHEALTVAEPQPTPGRRSVSRERPDSHPHGRFLPGSLLLDRYRIVAKLGQGGMGEVYRADDLTLGEAVALKFDSSLDMDQKRLDLFRNEVRLSRQLAHPHICRVHDIGEVDGLHFLSMEYIDGEDLKSLLQRIGRLPRDKGLQIAGQLCAGLAFAHDKGVLHRDLKPANIMIDGKGQARLTDFGLATILADTNGGARSGTPAYMAPEQLDSGEATVRTDLYALGLILYELFTGQRVHSGSTIQAQKSDRHRQIPPPSAVAGDIDPALERVIMRCLAGSPSQRPASVAEVAEQINAATRASGLKPRAPVQPSPLHSVARSWLRPDADGVQLGGWQRAGIGFCLAMATGMLMGFICGNVFPHGPSTGPQQIPGKLVLAVTALGSIALIPLQRRRGLMLASLLLHLQLSVLWFTFIVGCLFGFARSANSEMVLVMILLIWGVSVVLGQGLLVVQHALWPPRKPGAYCPGCSYPLKGLKEKRCPECGRDFTLEELKITETALRV